MSRRRPVVVRLALVLALLAGTATRILAQGARNLDLDRVNAWRTSQNLAAVAQDDIDSTEFQSFDVRASKSFALRGTQRIELIAQLFNVFDAVNLSGIQTNALASTFGAASRAAAGRQAELAVRFLW